MSKSIKDDITQEKEPIVRTRYRKIGEKPDRLVLEYVGNHTVIEKEFIENINTNV